MAPGIKRLPVRPTERKPKDRDFIQTREGLFFCVTGYLHPPGRYTAYLKYSPDQLSRPSKEAHGYRQELAWEGAANIADTMRYVAYQYPYYVHHCPVRNVRLSMVPHSHVVRYFAPEERLQELVAAPHDLLEEEVGEFAAELANCAGISPDSLGVTGSVLIGLHDPVFSPVELVVYGLDNGRKLRAAIAESLHVKPLDQPAIDNWIVGVTKRLSVSPALARYLSTRRWNHGYFHRRYFSIFPTRIDGEITEKYGEHFYRSRGAARLQATILDANEGLFLPSVYRVTEVAVLEGSAGEHEVRHIVSQEELYRDVAEAGQRVEAYGKLETVDGETCRLVVAPFELQGKGYIKPVRV